MAALLDPETLTANRARYSKVWRAANADKIKADRKAYAKANVEEIAAYQKAYRAAHAAKISAYNAAMYVANADLIKARSAAYRAANPEHSRDVTQAWQDAHPERMLEISRQQHGRRRARKHGAVVTKADYRAILAEFGMVCHICGLDILTRTDLHFDHVIPLSKGGAHSPANIRPSHASCNMRKGARIEVSNEPLPDLRAA